MFSMASDNPIFLNAIPKTSEPEAFYAGYEMIRQAFMDEHEYSSHTAFLGGLVDAKCNVQKGQVRLVAKVKLLLFLHK